MSELVVDLIEETRRCIAAERPASAATVRRLGHAIAGFSRTMAGEFGAFKAFLFERMYRHRMVMEPMEKAKRVISELFEAFSREPALLPPDWASGCDGPGSSATARIVRDYIAGMTDRFALEEHARITHSEIVL